MQAKRSGGSAAGSPGARLPESSATSGSDSSHGKASARPAPRRKVRRETPCARSNRLAAAMGRLSCWFSREHRLTAAKTELFAGDDIDNQIGHRSLARFDVGCHRLHELAVGG